MKQLAEYTKNQYHFTLIKRVGDYAVFAGIKEDKPNTNWEVIHIRVTPAGSRIIQDPKTGKAKQLQWDAHERPPGDNEWGLHGWTCLTLESAIAKLNQLTQTLTQPTPST